MKVGIDIEKFLHHIESYATDTRFDYTYYLVTHELRRMKIIERIGQLRPEHMNPILLLLRDWMPAGWISWSEKTGKRWKMDSELCEALNKLRNELHILCELDIAHFDPHRHGNAVKKIFEKIYELNLGVSKKAIATVVSKVLHLLNPRLFVMWDTRIIDFYECKPNAEGYLNFLTDMMELAKQLKPHLSRISEKTEELRKKASEVYGMEICSQKSLAKLIDEYNWIEVRGHY